MSLVMACAAFNFRKFVRILCFCVTYSLGALGIYFDPMFSLSRPVRDVAL